MMHGIKLRMALHAIFLCSCLVPSALAQTETAAISGRVTDHSGAVVSNASLHLVNIDQGTETSTKTNASGIYILPSVQPGRYRIQVEHDGFKIADLVGLTVNVQDNLEENFRLEVGSVSESVTVDGDANNLNTSDASVSTVIDRQFVENIPMNGRSFETLVLLSPGTVTNNPNGSEQGEYSVNGMRTDSNGFSVDGASASNAPSTAITSGNSASLSSATALGTTQSMLMIDAMEEFRMATSTYSAEYGNHPGAQVSFRSRSGTNQYQGTLYEYLRNSFFDANDWFNNYSTPSVPTPAERQNDFGGVFGGPLSIPHLFSGRDRAFFFGAYEGLRLSVPSAATIYDVPSNGTYITNYAAYATDPMAANLRANTALNGHPELQSWLDSWPLPNCTVNMDPQCVDYGSGGTAYISSPKSIAAINSISARVDYQILPTMRLFARYADTTSRKTQFGGTGPAAGPYEAVLHLRNRTYLLGVDNIFGSNITNELRLQYSPAVYLTYMVPTQVGGAAPYSYYAAEGIPNPVGETYIRVYLPNETSNYDENYGTSQFQPNVTEALTWTHGRHLFKFGGTYIQTTAYFNRGNLSRSPGVEYHFNNADEILNNVTHNEDLSLSPREDPTFKSMGFYGQDEWRPLSKLTVSMGVRWDIDPPPSISGPPEFTYTGNVLVPSSLGVSAPRAPLYKTDYHDIAPRLGLALVVHNQPGHQLVLRAGAGSFFETVGLTGLTLGYTTTFNTSGSAFPLQITAAQLNQTTVTQPPPGTAYDFNGYPANNLVPPYALQWNLTMEQELGTKQSFTLGYVASAGRKLITNRDYNVITENPGFGTFALYTNGPGSSYNSLQVKYQRRMSNGFQALASYTWAHSIDNVSTSTALLPTEKGDSDHDIRHNLTGALIYNLPTPYRNRLEKAILGHWITSLWFVARTAFPYNPQGAEITDPLTGDEYYGELNYNGQYPYVHERGIPGGRQLNPAVFSIASAPSGLGNAPRNFLRAFGEIQANTSIQRDFPIYERVKLEFRAEAFNLTNHPNFGQVYTGCSGTGTPPAGSVCNNPLMGQAENMLATGLGNLSSLYQQGGPRSLEFMLRLQF